jgi:homocysteine S-methyltransferase
LRKKDRSISRLFEKALEGDRPILLDGGLATELESRGVNIDTDLWSAAILQSNPQAIVDAHRSYLEAGANCIISASYQASRPGFMAFGLLADEADALISSSVILAQTARRQYLNVHDLNNLGDVGGGPLVAASVGPFGAYRHDSSEYTGNYGVTSETLKEFHEQRLELLDACNADVLACETIPNIDEARVLCELLKHCNSPAWVSFSCADGYNISDGTPLREAAAMFRDHNRVLAVGINCTAPQYVKSLIAELRAGAPDKAIVVYPNSGETYNDYNNTWTGMVTPIECGEAALDWRDAGARIIGGCCRMGPPHIAAMRNSLA